MSDHEKMERYAEMLAALKVFRDLAWPTDDPSYLLRRMREMVGPIIERAEAAWPERWDFESNEEDEPDA